MRFSVPLILCLALLLLSAYASASSFLPTNNMAYEQKQAYGREMAVYYFLLLSPPVLLLGGFVVIIHSFLKNEWRVLLAPTVSKVGLAVALSLPYWFLTAILVGGFDPIHLAAILLAFYAIACSAAYVWEKVSKKK